MQEIKDEDRIIAKILRGELRIDNLDIEYLVKADSTIEQEEIFDKLADEIKETINKNKTERNEIEEKINKAEQDRFTKLELMLTESEIRDKKEQIKSLDNNMIKYIVGELALTLILMLVSSFVLSGLIFWNMFTTICVALIGALSIFSSVKFTTKKIAKIKLKINKLENERLELIEDQKLISIKNYAEVVRKKNFVNRIYKEKEINFNEEELNQSNDWF
jgi:ABC-type multidrug transport system fused ATPase/permease subunit